MINNISAKQQTSIMKVKGLGILLLISPLAALVMAMRSFRSNQSRKIILAILILYGLTMSFAGDSMGEANVFKDWYYRGFSELEYYLSNIYKSGTNVDFFQQIVMFIVSRFTDNPNLYFGVVAGIFGWFYLQSLGHIFDHFNPLSNRNALFHFLLFTMLLPVFYISGSRWALAAWIYFYGAYNYFFQHEKRFIYFTLSSLFVHFSFIGPVVLFFSFMFAGKRNLLYYGLIVASFVIQPLAGNYLSGMETETFQGVQERVSVYTNEETIEIRQQGSQNLAWYVKYPGQMIWYYLAIGIFWARRKYKFISKDKLLETLYSFSLLLFALANTFLKIPSGERFRMIFFMFATVYLIVLFAKTRAKLLSPITLLGVIPMFLYFVLELRRGFDTLNIALAGPLPIAFFWDFTLF